MAELVVDRFELVDVDVDEREAALVAAGAFELLLDTDAEGRMVEELGERVPFATVVAVRSNSGGSGRMSVESETSTPGSSSARISRTRCSCVGFMWPLMRQTATDSSPRARSLRATSWTEPSSSGRTIAPA